MPRDQTKQLNKGKQPSVEPLDRENTGEESSGEASGEIGGELVLITAIRRHSIPGFSADQVQQLNAITNQMTAMMDAKLEAQARYFETSQSSLIAAIQQLQQSIADISHTDLPAANQSSRQLATLYSDQQFDTW